MISRRGWLIISGVVAVYAGLLITDVAPVVRGPEEWRWARWPTLRWEMVWPVAALLASVAAGAWWIDRRAAAGRERRWIAIGLAGLIIAAPLVQLAALRVERLNPWAALFDRAVDVAANGYFTVSHQISDVADFLRQYPALMPTFPIHPQVHPPGIPLIYWAAAQVFEAAPQLARSVALGFRSLECNDINLMLLSDAQLASALAGMVLPMLANMLTVLGVFKLAQARFGARAGLWAAALWVAVPSAALFPGSWSQVYPCLAVFTWLAMDAGLRRRQARWFLAAGGLLSISTFLELGTAALALFLVLYILLGYVIERRNLWRDLVFLLRALAAALIGVFSIWSVYQAAYGVSLMQIVEAMYPIHTGYEFDRLTWLINHPYEFAVFSGLPIALLLAAITARSIRQARSGAVDVLSISLGVGLIVLSIIDPARDETARTWMMFMPLAAAVAAQLFARWSKRAHVLAWGLLIGQVVVMLAVLRVMEVGLYGLPPRETVADLPGSATSAQADFGGMAQLLGYEISPGPDQLVLTLYWRAVNQVDRPYVVFNHLVDANGQIVAQADGRPQHGSPLMTCWQPGELYADQHVLPLKTPPSADLYRLSIGLYDAQTGARVPVSNAAGGLPADHVETEPISLAR